MFESLDAEWASLSASRDARAALVRWRLLEPVLDADHVDAVVERARADGGGDVLRALARLAHRDRFACRTLLQLLVPGLAAIARSARPVDDETVADIVSLAWERIRTYPTHRPGSVAANVLFDVRKGLAAARRQQVPGLDADPEQHVHDRAPSAEDVVLGGESDVVRRLLDARSRGVISDVALRAIVRTRVVGDSIDEAAAAEALPARVLLLRRWRGERALRRDLAPLALAG